ncbi:MAG TPA: SRPBCC family protein [Leifsonia sp.]|jgi:hypothetical protein|nr:SRPBCC family protein [Leifsonia sp.]
MWSTEHTQETTVPREAVWSVLRDLHSGRITYPGADVFEPHGPFAVGTELTMTPEGQDPVTSTIIDIVENETYADETVFGDVVLTFRHTLVPTPSGTRVTHSLKITGPDADQVGPELGPQISGDFPESLAALLEQATLRA